MSQPEDTQDEHERMKAEHPWLEAYSDALAAGKQLLFHLNLVLGKSGISLDTHVYRGFPEAAPAETAAIIERLTLVCAGETECTMDDLLTYAFVLGLPVKFQMSSQGFNLHIGD